MKLTIGMIVKNEEKWLDKCLSAIKPILDNVDSELIITDTGSTDRTVEIARKYTDKVLHFDWINDFSAARNFGLEKAQGEWFMMLDADDIFRSCDHIIDFFNSGDYKKYNAATYISRNLFKTDNGDSYGDLLAPRMVRIQPNTRYENAIHESLNTFQPPYKNLQDIADHYGYYYETEEDKYKKFKRNTELLLKRFETEKETAPMLYVQLYEAFMGIEDLDKALEYLNSGIDFCKRTNSIVLAALYFHKASYYQTGKKYEDSIAVCDDYFKMNKVIRPYPLSTDGEINAIKAMCLYELERYSEAVESFKQFFANYKDIESGKLATYDRYLYSAYMCSEVNILPLFNNFIDSCIKSEKINTADNWLSTYPVYRYSFELQKISELVEYELAVSEHFEYKTASNYYKKLDPHGKKMFLDKLFNASGKTDGRESILEAIDDISKTDDKTANKIVVYKKLYNGENCSEDIYRFIDKFGTAEDADMLSILMKLQYDISPAILSKNFDSRQAAFLCCKNIDGFYKIAENYNADILTDINSLPIAARFYEYCISMRLIENEDKSEEEKQNLISKLFRIKTALNERYKRDNSVKSEFELLAASVKKNIRSFIYAGNFEAAKKTLEDYKKINPKDPDISGLMMLIK